MFLLILVGRIRRACCAHISQEFTETVFLIFKGIIIDGESRDFLHLQLSTVGNQQE